MDIDKLTELAQKIIQVADTEKRYKATENLQQKIVEDIGGVISACSDLIRGNTTLRFDGYQRYIFFMYGGYRNIHLDCITILTDYLSDIEEYEADTEKKRAER